MQASRTQNGECDLTAKSGSGISVIIVTYYTGPILFRTIESVLAESNDSELIIVDNGNSLSTLEKLNFFLQNYAARIKFLSGHGNIGFAAACNLGAAVASNSYLLLLNPDCVLLEPHSLRIIIQELSNHNAVLASCNITNPDGSRQKTSVRNIITPFSALVESLNLYRFSPRLERYRINLGHKETGFHTKFVPAISGAFMIIKKSDYEKLKGLDENYFLHVEDMDLCLRASKELGKIIYVPSVKVVHYLSTSDVANKIVEEHKTKGFIYYFDKNFSNFSKIWLVAVKLFIYLRHFLKAGYNNVKSICKRQIANNITLQKEKFLQNISLDTASPKLTADNILITGTTGQIGLCILRRLLALNQVLTAFYYREVIGIVKPNVKWVQANFAGNCSHLNTLKGDVLICTSPLWLLPPLLDNLANAGLKRLICFSSTSIFTKSSSANLKEKATIAKLLQAELEVREKCKQYNINYTILRPTLIYGIGLDQNITNVAKFIHKFGFFPLISNATGLRQPVHADDLAQTALSIINNPKTYNKAYNLSGPEQIPYQEMIGKVFDAIGKKRKFFICNLLPLLFDIVSFLRLSRSINGEMARRMSFDMVFTDDNAKRDFDYKPRNFLNGGEQDLSL